MKRNKPNFFIIGAPKCGTTALSEYLRQHPNVFMTTPKEPHYFATDLGDYRACKSEEEYKSLFKSVKKEHLAIGEASVFYLYSEDAISNISKRYENAKIIIMLRNPIEMVYSFHVQAFQDTVDDIEDFQEAWEYEEFRKQGKRLPKFTKAPKILYYSEIAKYFEQLTRVFKYFPKSQVKVILFDDFRNNTKKIYEEILDFLELKSDERIVFPVINENAQIKNATLHLFLRNLPQPLVKVLNIIKRAIGMKNVNIRKNIKEWNSVKTKREPLDIGMKKKLLNNYEQDILRLSRMLDRDLSHWIK